MNKEASRTMWKAVKFKYQAIGESNHRKAEKEDR